MIVPSRVSATLDAAEESLLANVEDADTVIFQITGTFTGTLSFETSLDGTNYVALGVLNVGAVSPATFVTSATAAGIFTMTQPTARGISDIRIRMSAYTSGSAVVTLKAARSAK